MSGMNFLEKLLDGVAVKWKTLEEVANFANGKGHEKDIIEDGKYVVVNSKFISTDGRVAKFSNIQICPLFKDDILLVMSDLPNGKALSKTFIVDAGDRYTLNQRIGGITVKNQGEILPKFLHCFLNRTPQLLKYDNGVDQTNLRKDQILGVKIPIPCPENPKKSLAIQAEIVRILDTFTALTAELTAALTAELSDRKKQSNYYRDRLLNFGDEVPVVQLSRCCVSIADGDHQAPPKTDMGIPFITISNVSNSYQIDFINTRFVSEAYYGGLDDKRKARKNDILYTVVGSLGIPVFIGDNRKFAFQRHIAILRPNGNVIIPKYLYHVLRSSDFLKQAYAVAVGAAQKTITLTALNRMKISMPPLEEQARIVALLDKFDTLTHSISEGLPREIALRRKQYEYYRDLLLTFPKPEEVKMHLATVEKSHE